MTTETPGEPKGRPRIEGDREAEILDAALDLLMEVGYDRLTMDAVARRASASKATLYRRWESKPALVIDALVRSKNAPEVVFEDTGSLRGDLMATFCSGHAINKQTTGMLGAVITALGNDPEFAERFRSEFIAPKIAVSREIYQRAVERGEIDGDLDFEVIVPALAGILLHRMYILGIAPDDDTIRRVVDHVILPAVLNPVTNPASSTTSDRKKR